MSTIWTVLSESSRAVLVPSGVAETTRTLWMVLTPRAANFDSAAAPMEGGRRGRRCLVPERMVSSALG